MQSINTNSLLKTRLKQRNKVHNRNICILDTGYRLHMLDKKLHQIDAKILRQYRRRCKKDGIINPAETCLASGESLGNFLRIIKFRVKLPGENGGDRIGRISMQAVDSDWKFHRDHEYTLCWISKKQLGGVIFL